MGGFRLSRHAVEITSAGQKLMGVLHLPDGASAPVPGILILHGFGGNKIGPHRIHVLSAAALAAAGFAALRVDCRGSGDSEGDFADTTLSDWLRDGTAALDFLAARPGIDAARLGVQGYSLGGAAAALLAGRDPRIRAACLWAPVANLDHFEDLGHVARLQGQVDLGGQRLHRAFFADAGNHDPVAALRGCSADALIVRGSADDEVPDEHAEAYVAALGPGRVQLEALPGANHNFDAVHWVDELVATTTRWWLSCWA